ncbi:MAG TPA: hypothetical protein VLE22_22130 [Bryobacteraceae bacterium]|nr:hypothetical protein [Bryobacteraceae bacterium]
MRPSRTAVVLYLLIVFLSGALVGALAHRLYVIRGVENGGPARPESYRSRYIEEMRTRLNLDEGQVQLLNGILDDARTRYRAAREKIRPELDTIRQDQVGKIRSMLSEGQRIEYEKLLEEREKRHRQRPTPH